MPTIRNTGTHEHFPQTRHVLQKGMLLPSVLDGVAQPLTYTRDGLVGRGMQKKADREEGTTGSPPPPPSIRSHLLHSSISSDLTEQTHFTVRPGQTNISPVSCSRVAKTGNQAQWRKSRAPQRRQTRTHAGAHTSPHCSRLLSLHASQSSCGLRTSPSADKAPRIETTLPGGTGAQRPQGNRLLPSYSWDSHYTHPTPSSLDRAIGPVY